ncbi:MAG: response regulator [Lachnospiraceae bacterium]|nr:response regulator [Lachnospiraceae bacterium]
MVFRMVFILCALISLTCTVVGVRFKRRNIGFLIASVLVAVCDVICFFLLGCKSVGGARNALLAYYICQTWLYFAVLWTIGVMGRHRHIVRYLIPMGLLCGYETVVIASNFFGNRFLSFSKHILLGRTWWVAERAQYATNKILSYAVYRNLIFVSALLILAVMIVNCVRSARLFRVKFYVLMLVQAVYVVAEIFATLRTWPVWIVCLSMNLICVIGFYYVNCYSNSKLRDWSLMSFANEMSDGFILYNEFQDLIHMNDLLKNTLPQELLDSFADKAKLDDWISRTTFIENIEVLTCGGAEREIYFKVRKTEVGEKGKSLGTIYILHDTTESIRQMRIMEKANQELELAAKMKSDFLANMSHEIRTPMNAVIGMAEIAMREKLPPQVQDYLMQIQNSWRNLLNIINDILDFSKIEAGKMEIIPDRYEPLSELNDIANILETRIGEKNLELFVTVDEKMPHTLEGDAMRIRQILINLANNAIKFTKEGTVNIQVSCEKQAEDEVLLTYHVVDTGSGIKEEDLQKLFVSFQQVDSKRNRAVEGTGLGLAISRSLCEAMGGTIGVTSEYGKGSDFYFSIPQKVVVSATDLVVEDAQAKHAFCCSTDSRLTAVFAEEMRKLGVDGKVLQSPAEYRSTGEQDFLFFDEAQYGEYIGNLLNFNRKCSGVVLVGFDSLFASGQSNLRVMRKPLTTLGLVLALNGKDVGDYVVKEQQTFEADCIAPDAKILIVDDNAINLTIAQGLLEPLQTQCQTAGSGKEAIEKVKTEHYDIILMDHMMPEMDGIETTRIIRSTVENAEHIPIIALTANAMNGVREMFIREGMNDFVAKPIDVKELIEKVTKWLPQEKLQTGGAGQRAQAMPADDITYEGLDCERAIQALGSAALFHKIVKEYYRSGKDKADGIQKAYDTKDWRDYTIRVHALKSSSRQIGAMGLGSLAEQLENAGNALDTETIQKKTGELLQQFTEQLAVLARYFVEETETANLPVISEELLQEQLQQLAQACDDLDMDRMEQVKELLQGYALPDDLRGSEDTLYDAIDNMDIDGCMEWIRKAQKVDMAQLNMLL